MSENKKEFMIIDCKSNKENSLQEAEVIRKTIIAGGFALAGAAYGVCATTLWALEGFNVVTAIGLILAVSCFGASIEEIKDKEELFKTSDTKPIKDLER